MRTVMSLIDEAANLCGSQAELARRIGVHRAQVTAWKTGDEPISPENVALLCDVLELSGEEARRLAVLAIVANPKNAKRAEALRRAFFVSLALGAVGGPLLFSPSEGMAKTPGESTGMVRGIYIVHNESSTTCPPQMSMLVTLPPDR